MHTVSFFRKGKEIFRCFKTESQAVEYAKTFWHLDPIVKDPLGKTVYFDTCDCLDEF